MDDGGEFEDFDLGGWSGQSWRQQTITSQPFERVAVVAEVAALEFKLDVNALPTLGLSWRLASPSGKPDWIDSTMQPSSLVPLARANDP